MDSDIDARIRSRMSGDMGRTLIVSPPVNTHVFFFHHYMYFSLVLCFIHFFNHQAMRLRMTTLITCTAENLGGGVYFQTVAITAFNHKLSAVSISAKDNTAKGAGGVFFWTKNPKIMTKGSEGIKVSLLKDLGGNSAKVGNIIASGPFKMIHWVGPLHGAAGSIDRTIITYGTLMNRAKAKLDNPSLFPAEISAGKFFHMEVAILDYYGQHLNIKEGSDVGATKLHTKMKKKIASEWHYHKTELHTPQIVGGELGRTAMGLVKFSRLRVLARPGGVYTIVVHSEALGLHSELSIDIAVRYCTYGEYLNTRGKEYCQLCPQGRGSNVTGAAVPRACQQCRPGQFQKLTGQKMCNHCAVGRYQRSFGSKMDCIECSHGTFQNETSSSTCLICAIGRFRNQRSRRLLDGTINDGTLCDICPVGKHTVNTRQSGCSECPAGQYGAFDADVVDIDGKKRDITRCSLCPAGRRSTKVGATSIEACVPCKSGHYTSEEGSTKCIGCATREWTSGKQGASVCELCPAGMYSVPDGERCQSCPDGNYQNISGQVSCKICPDGEWTLGKSNTEECIPCTASQIFMPDTRTCIECASPLHADRFAVLPGEDQLTCRHCPQGAICRGDGYITAMPGWWMSGGMDAEREGCVPDPRRPPRRCGDGAMKCVSDEKMGQFFDECDVKRFLFRCSVQRPTGLPQVCNPFTDLQLKARQETGGNVANVLVENNTNTTIINTTLEVAASVRSSQCLCLEGVECYEGRMCENCATGYVRTGEKECKYCDVFPIPAIQLAGFILLLLVLLCLFIKVTVKSAGSSSPAGSMKKIVINFLQLESLAMGFPLQWPALVTTMFSSFGVSSSANADLFVIECIMPSQMFQVLPAVYQKTIIVALMPISFMLLCGLAWFCHDHLCRPKVSPMKHTAIPKHFYKKHAEHNREKAEKKRLIQQLHNLEDHDRIPRATRKEGSLDNDSEEDFGYIYRRALENASRHGIDVEASFIHFTNLETEEEQSENERLQKLNHLGKNSSSNAEMSTAAFEYMLLEWKSPVKNPALLWSMLKRVDTDGSGWISLSELRAFERSTLDRLILSSTVVAYMFYPTCCKAAFMLISCRSDLFDGVHRWYLNEDLSQPCWGTTHLAAVMMIGIPTLIIWVIGMPLFIFVVLESHRKDKHNDKIRFRYGMLMEGYEDELFYWESVIASRKMLVIGVSVFLSSYSVDVQAYIGIAIVILFMTMHINSNPYNSQVLDSMEKYALGTAFCTLYVGMLFYILKEDGVDNSTLVIVGSLFIVGINMLYLCYAVWEILLYYASIKRHGSAKSCMRCLIPVTNCLCCRSKKARKKTHRLLHKATIRMSSVNGMGGSERSGSGSGSGISSGNSVKVIPVNLSYIKNFGVIEEKSVELEKIPEVHDDKILAKMGTKEDDQDQQLLQPAVAVAAVASRAGQPERPH